VVNRFAFFRPERQIYRNYRYEAFSLTWPAAMQIYWNKQKKVFTYEKSSIPTGLVWYTNMAAVPLLWNNNMAAVTSCENAL